MSPESLDPKNPKMSHKSDIWSLGATVHECCMLEATFKGENRDEIEKNILKKTPTQLPSHFSGELDSLILEMLDKDPEQRPTARKILTTSIVQKFLQSNLTFRAVGNNDRLNNYNVERATEDHHFKQEYVSEGNQNDDSLQDDDELSFMTGSVDTEKES